MLSYYKVGGLPLCFNHLFFTPLMRRNSQPRVMGMAEHVIPETGWMKLAAVYPYTHTEEDIITYYTGSHRGSAEEQDKQLGLHEEDFIIMRVWAAFWLPWEDALGLFK